MESYLADLARGFREAGDQVHVYAEKIDRTLSKTLGVEAHQIAIPPLPRMLRNATFAKRIDKLGLRQRYSLVIALARTRGHHVAINGGTHPGYVEAIGRRIGLHDREQIRLERAMLEEADTIVAHSRMLADEIADHYPTVKVRAQVLYPPVNSARFQIGETAERAALRLEVGLAPDHCAFLFPSMDHRRKGLAPLLEAFASAPPEARLLIAGRAPNLRLPRNASALGYVTNMASLYAAVDWTILPALYEPFGLVIAESLACGTPAIVGARVGAAELLGDDECIRLAASEASAIGSAIRKACAVRWRVAPGFVERHGLGLAAHIQEIKKLAPRVCATAS